MSDKIVPTIGNLDHTVSSDRIYVVVDAFLFTTTVTTALYEGVDEVYITRNKKELLELNKKYSIPIGGERELHNDNIQLSNSPYFFAQTEQLPSRVGLTSANGAKIIMELIDKGAENILLGCFRNAKYVSQQLNNTSLDYHIIPSNSDYSPVIDDIVCGLFIRDQVDNQLSNKENKLIERLSQYSYAYQERGSGNIEEINNRQLIIEQNTVSVVPEYQTNNIGNYFTPLTK